MTGSAISKKKIFEGFFFKAIWLPNHMTDDVIKMFVDHFMGHFHKSGSGNGKDCPRIFIQFGVLIPGVATSSVNPK